MTFALALAALALLGVEQAPGAPAVTPPDANLSLQNATVHGTTTTTVRATTTTARPTTTTTKTAVCGTTGTTVKKGTTTTTSCPIGPVDGP